jgi:hypothetical protein
MPAAFQPAISLPMILQNASALFLSRAYTESPFCDSEINYGFLLDLSRNQISGIDPDFPRAGETAFLFY